MKLNFWRHRYSLELPWGKHSASFIAGADRIEDIEHDDNTGAVRITHEEYLLVIQGEGFGWTKRAKKKVKAEKQGPTAEPV